MCYLSMNKPKNYNIPANAARYFGRDAKAWVIVSQNPVRPVTGGSSAEAFHFHIEG